MRKTRYIPPIVTFTAGAIAIIITTLQHYELQTKLIIVLASLFGFYIIGSIAKAVIDRYAQIPPQKEQDEGEVIEKGETEETEASDEDSSAT